MNRLTIDQLKSFFEPLGLEVWPRANNLGHIRKIGLYRRQGKNVVEEYEWQVQPENPTVHIETVKHAITTLKRRAA